MERNWMFFVFLLNWLSAPVSECQKQHSTYKAAVLEHQSVPFNDDPQVTMRANVEIYATNARRAAEQGADIIVFPEYGMLGLGHPPSSWIYKDDEIFLDLPKELDGTLPCLQESELAGYQILKQLSCMSRNYSIASIVNQLIKEKCDPATTPKCPTRGYFKFNANIIFSKNGTLLGRYHKRHLFRESDLNPAPEPEFEIVDLGFVKFGTIICFDIMYADPAVQYITQHGIKNILFSTAWIDELPYLTSPQLYTRFARGMGINLIVSNAYNPLITRLGSGLYSSQLGGINETYDLATPGRLLVAELPIEPEPVPSGSFECTFNSINLPEPLSPRSFNESQYEFTDLPSSSTNVNKTHKIYYQDLSNFTYLFLNDTQDHLTLCDYDLCCELDYKFADRNGTVYAFAVRNGMHPFSIYRMYMQVCSVLRCESEDIQTCGRVPKKITSATFEKMTLSGGFVTDTILPSILSTDLLPISSDNWDFSKGHCKNNRAINVSGAEISMKGLTSKPIMVASIYGRVFERDQDPAADTD